MEMKTSNKQFDDVKSSIHTDALKLASQLDGLNSCEPVIIKACEDMIRRLVEELDNKQQCLIEASGMLFNYKYELDLERAMSAQLKEELDRHK